jgi:carbonic anhydrase
MGGKPMITRRLFCGCLAGAGAFVATSAHAQMDQCAVYTADRQKKVTPVDAIALLREGNDRMVAGKSINCDLIKQIRATASAQAPFAAVLGCIDSRVPPELVFDQRVGDIFCARVAGNFVNTDILGSLEFSTKVAGAKAIVVLGHNNCGAIKGAVDRVKLGNLTAMLENFEPALKAVGKFEGEQDSHNIEWVQKVALANVRITVDEIKKRSSVIADQIAKGEVQVAGAMHDLATGKVTWLS